MKDKRPLISASEVGEYTFCARAWRLHAEGYDPDDALRRAQNAGTEFHREHGREVVLAGRLRAAAVVFAALSLFVLLLLALHLVLR